MQYAKDAQVGLASNSSLPRTPLQDAFQRLTFQIQDLKSAYGELHTRLASAGVLSTSPRSMDKRPERATYPAPVVEQVNVFADHAEELRDLIRETIEDLAI